VTTVKCKPGYTDCGDYCSPPGHACH
jgi:hypothetical protein